MAIRSILITGANRGIGLEFVKQFTEVTPPPQFIFAGCRNPEGANDLKEIAQKHQNVKILKIDVGDESSYKSAVATVTDAVGKQGLNVLFNNAGIINTKKFQEVTAEDMRRNFEVNTVGPMVITQHFYPLLKLAAASAAPDTASFSCSRAAVLNMTSGMGRIGDNKSGGCYAYRAAKAALNMITKSMSVDFKSDKILAVTMDPGWVGTDMGGKSASITPTQCVQALRDVMAKLSEKENGCVMSWRGHAVDY